MGGICICFMALKGWGYVFSLNFEGSGTYFFLTVEYYGCFLPYSQVVLSSMSHAVFDIMNGLTPCFLMGHQIFSLKEKCANI